MNKNRIQCYERNLVLKRKTEYTLYSLCCFNLDISTVNTNVPISYIPNPHILPILIFPIQPYYPPVQQINIENKEKYYPPANPSISNYIKYKRK